ncbi:PREDICTED: lysosomal Pro-X carboxypeptidase [Papilio xuthus]|uniref:Lysosomal Pro-X carboxypeptidase n=1 Tax=Papilio xuthus TaxID=66420 RepID=A0AAJ7EFT8_PAPXU|nr:PREDICTED: lysosomal Pro-X carboxypeptidase [Papilio xuthus]
MRHATYILVLFLGTVAAYHNETKEFVVPLDHFGFQRNETFKIRYIESDQYWNRGNGPIFFYTGNEGQIESFAKHTGFMWEIAREFEAKIIFAEHRYYGKSMPFGDKSLDNEHIGYLTSAQALADYAQLVNFLQGGKNLKPKYPVIAFGGSYGGMLAAYFRIKYPHLVQGAIAASAPVHMFSGMVPCEVFHRIVTSSFNVASKVCRDNIRQSWSVLRTFVANKTNADWLKKEWNLCVAVNDTKEDVQDLIDYLQGMYDTLAMVNYPFASDFLLPLPANPVRSVCQYLSEKLTGQKLLEGIGKVLQVYTNYNGKGECVNYKSTDYGNLNATGWDYQACTEMVMPMCTNGVDDMFEPMPWNFTEFSEECHKKYKVYPRPEAAWLQYGGDRLQAASNIIFSNGLLDPWAGGGLLSSISDTIKAVVMIDTAHHLDLMPQNSDDPESVKMARQEHKRNIEQWIRNFRLNNA